MGIWEEPSLPQVVVSVKGLLRRGGERFLCGLLQGCW